MRLHRQRTARPLSLLAALALGACSGSGSSDPTPPPDPRPLTIATQPESQVILAGSTATFSVIASGTGTLAYQWRRDGRIVPGATAATYTTPSAVVGQPVEIFDVVVSDTYGHVVTSADAALTVMPAPRFAFVGGASDPAVWSYTVDAATGQLRRGSQARTGLSPVVATDSTGAFVFVASADEGRVYQYAVLSEGTLVPLTPEQVAAGADPVWVAVRAEEPFVYVVNRGSNDVYQYLNLGTQQGLEPLPAVTASTGPGPVGLTFHPSGAFGYVANGSDGTISQYAVDTRVLRNLVPLDPPQVSAGIGPGPVAIDPLGSFAYAPDASGNVILQYAVGAGGQLSPLSPPSVAAGRGPRAMAIDPTGRWAYAVNGSDDSVSQYAIGGDGRLSPLATATVAVGTRPVAVAVDPSGRFVYVVNSTAGTISQFAIGAGGGLTPLATPVVQAPAMPQSIALTGGLPVP